MSLFSTDAPTLPPGTVTSEARTVLYLLVGLPAAGKTTRARELEHQHRALRLTPDEWMIPLFGESDAGGKRDILEGRLIWVALRALQLGTSVVLDFGLWGRDERSALRAMAESLGAKAKVIYLPVDEQTQQRRVRHRYEVAPERTFEITAADLATYQALFQVPSQAELDGTLLDGPPSGWMTWPAWAEQRWPSLSGK